MTSGIYSIRNRETGKQYIGSSVGLHRRFSAHRYLLNAGEHHSIHLQRAWDKWGAAAFDFEIVLLCDPSMLRDYEQRCFTAFAPKYNIARDATASALGTKASEQTKKKMSNAHQGFEHTPEAIEKMRTAALMRGPRSEEYLKHMSEAQLGKKNGPPTQEHRDKISKALTGRKHSAPRTPMTGNIIFCVVCGTPRYVQAYRLSNAKYCSLTCNGIAKRAQEPQKVISSHEPLTINQEAA